LSDYIFTPPAPPHVPVEGGGRFFVRRIWCVGRNYTDHILEMGNDTREPPVFFAKPADAVVIEDGDTPYPPRTIDFHHEIELVVAIGRAGKDIAVGDALSHVWGYAVGIDMTRRDLQHRYKAKGSPWEMAKGFDHSAPIGRLVPAERIGHPARGSITLHVNGETRQAADLGDQIWSVPEAIAELSSYVTLMPGDLIMTGTPAGVGAVNRGDVLEGEIAGVGKVRTRIA
jgi:fumarylpyruvate hydrolase